MPYIAYLFHLLIIPTRATGNPELEAALPYQQIYLETVLVAGETGAATSRKDAAPPTLPPLWVTSGVSRTREDLRAACSRHGPARRSVGWLTCLPKSGMYLLTRQPEPALNATGAH